MKTLNRLMVLSLLGLSLNVSAQTVVDDAWVRATVAGQSSTGAFMHLTSSTDSKLVEVKSPVAKTVEIHESTMKNDVMNMHAVPFVALPAGKTVKIEPEGLHVMLMDLTGQVKDGDQVPLTLVIEDAQGVKQSIEVNAQARALNSMPMDKHKHDHGAAH
ncbi:copper chaperone PCu(A)C [Pseudomonas sp. SIMBA_077]